MATLKRLFFMAAYMLCLFCALFSLYMAYASYKAGMPVSESVIWGIGGVILLVIGVLLYRIYLKLIGRR